MPCRRRTPTIFVSGGEGAEKGDGCTLCYPMQQPCWAVARQWHSLSGKATCSQTCVRRAAQGTPLRYNVGMLSGRWLLALIADLPMTPAAGTLSSVWLRLEALKASVKLKVKRLIPCTPLPFPCFCHPTCRQYSACSAKRCCDAVAPCGFRQAVNA